MRSVVLFRDLPASARRSLAPELPTHTRALVLFDVPPRIAQRFARATDAEGILVLPREVTPC